MLRLTGQALAIFRVPVEILSMANHAGAQVSHGEGFLLIIPFVALRNGFHICGHGLMNAVNAYDEILVPLRRINVHLPLPSCRTPISVSMALKSSVTFVLTSPPMRSPAHCLRRPILLLTCMIGLVHNREGGWEEVGVKAESGEESEVG